ncbi:MAG: methylmalonyl Co-A mutase-associated GTPase MeaB [Bacteroidetes bacterium]|nr:methylmalonyl Co-A mutase-associated GTPase MeaB [Bacteroidota bacterium]
MEQEKKNSDHIPGSALQVMEGVEQPDQINSEAVKKFKARKRSQHTVEELVEGILTGNRTLLSKAITLVESSLPDHQEQAQLIITACLQSLNSEIRNTKFEIQNPKFEIRNQSIRVGITGVPGVGKSTFIEALGKHLTAKGHKLAVLAIDPSSSRSKGSILGDKTRMEELAVDPNAFIRPSPAAGSLGGVARKTRETIILCEAAGFDVIFVETVGVGQSETTVHSMVDFFLLLMLAGAGDELQGIKRGIIEMADAIVVNKADGDNMNKAKTARMEYANALHLFPPPDSGWTPVADICSARSRMGIDHVWEIIMEHRKITGDNGYFHRRRMEQNRQIFRETIETGLQRHFFAQKEISQVIAKLEQEIMNGLENPYRKANELLEKYFRKE